MMSRGWIIFGTVLALGVLLSWIVPEFLGGIPFWILVGGAATLAVILLKPGIRKSSSPYLVSGEFLCDTCKYNHPGTCSRPDRPNATRCPDYRSRGN
jgi:hypothetical protein